MKTMTKYGVGNKLFSNNKGWREDIASAFIVILQGFGPWTYALEGRCSNPTELRNQTACKIEAFGANAQVFARISSNDRG